MFETLSSIDICRFLSVIRDSILDKTCNYDDVVIESLINIALKYKIKIPNEIVRYLECKKVIENEKGNVKKLKLK